MNVIKLQELSFRNAIYQKHEGWYKISWTLVTNCSKFDPNNALALRSQPVTVWMWSPGDWISVLELRHEISDFAFCTVFCITARTRINKRFFTFKVLFSFAICSWFNQSTRHTREIRGSDSDYRLAVAIGWMKVTLLSEYITLSSLTCSTVLEVTLHKYENIDWFLVFLEFANFAFKCWWPYSDYVRLIFSQLLDDLTLEFTVLTNFCSPF